MKMLVILLMIGAVVTVEAQPTKSLTLKDALDIALERNVSVIQARNSLEGSQSAQQAAVGSLLPTLAASGSYLNQRNWSPSTGGGTILVGGFPVDVPASGGSLMRESYSAGIDSRVVLFNGFANTSNVRRAQSNTSATEYSLNRTEQNTIFQTHQLYLNIVRTYELLKVNEDNLKRSQRQLERITESNKVGAVALADVYRQQVQVGTDELNLIQAQSNHEKAKQDLLAFLGVDFTTEFSFDFKGIPNDVDTSEFAAVNARYTNFGDLVNGALQKRPDYLSSIENVNGADASVTAARAGHFPTVSASASYGYNNTTLSTLGDNKNLSLNLNVSLPIFSGFATQNQIEQASVQRKNAEEGLNQARRQITVDIRKALLDLEASEKQLMVTKSSVVSAEMDRKIAEEKYNLGAGTLLDLLVANANYTNALSNKVNALINYLLAKKNTEFALGTISK